MKMPSISQVAGLVGISAVAYVILAATYTPPAPQPAAPTSSPVLVNGHYRIKDSYLGCVTAAAFTEADRRTMRLARSGDTMAANMAAGDAIASGQCVELGQGTLVDWDTSQSNWSGLACYRPIGFPRCFWTTPDLIERQ